MAFYLLQAAYNVTGAQALIAKPQPREDAITAAIESLGGKVHAFYFSFGDYDVAVIAEFPGTDSAAAFALSTAAGGAISKIHTTALLTPAEAVKAMKKAGKVSYVAPK
jgi:uncharacterized protein with GYD domain